MNKIMLICVFCLFMTATCDSQSPLAVKFEQTINSELAKQPLCLPVAGNLPVDILDARRSEKWAQDYAALEKVGLLRSSSVAVNSPMGSGPGKRFELSELGQKVATFSIPGDHSQVEFCYAKKAVHKILNWNDPTGGETSVSYNYELLNIASWAQSPEMRNAFNLAIQDALDKSYKGPKPRTETMELQMTHNGWQAWHP